MLCYGAKESCNDTTSHSGPQTLIVMRGDCFIPVIGRLGGDPWDVPEQYQTLLKLPCLQYPKTLSLPHVTATR